MWNGGSLCLAAASVERALEGGGIAAILPVHLFGAAAAGWKDLVEVAARHGVPILEDACQAHGAHFRGQPLGSFGAASAFSFYPTKNLGALGDAGLVATPEAGLAARLRAAPLRGPDPAAPPRRSRLEQPPRRAPGRGALPPASRPPRSESNPAPAGAPLPGGPARVAARLRRPGPGSGKRLASVRGSHRRAGRAAPASRQRRRRNARPLSGNAPAPGGVFAVRGGGRNLSEAERAAAEVLSLPLHQRLADSEAERVADAVRSFFGGRRSSPVSE